ncbi:cell death-inducing p53-target protein 1-like [Saccostrea echinata]|uniref:cell death-inducing p53-target protein 1-like n=1 Tax=Saccostrea echinata TaxID=191078 RepID=UPI002A7FD36F|nr:cell death-inducing p53-target protein 1-like [Saccostrea echinata]
MEEKVNTVIIVTKEKIDAWNVLDSHNPNQMECPHCQNGVVPVVVYKMGFLPPLLTCFMIVTGIFIMFAWLPLLDRRLKTIIHYCPTCNREIRRLTRF